MLKSLTLQNFKSFVSQKIDFKPLTILSGINCSGKSSVIEAISLLYDKSLASARGMRLNDGSMDLKRIKSFLSRDQFYCISADWNENINELKVSLSDSNANVSFSGVRFNENDLQLLLASRIGPQDSYQMNLNSDVPYLDRLGESVFDYIEKMNGKPEKFPVQPKLKRNEQVSFKDNVSEWLKIISPNSDLAYELSKDRLNAFVTYGGVPARESGFGLSFTIPVIAALLDPTKNTLIIENSEAHLHPKGQSQLCELIAKSVECGKQVILETHSDHIIDGVRLAVKRGVIKPDDVGIFFMSREPDEPTKIKEIKMLPNGDLSEWPDSFFDQSLLDAGELLYGKN